MCLEDLCLTTFMNCSWMNSVFVILALRSRADLMLTETKSLPIILSTGFMITILTILDNLNVCYTEIYY